MLEIAQAQQKIHDYCQPYARKQSSQYALARCCNRILSGNILCPINVPPADNSAMDGYAVCCEDVDTIPKQLRLSQRIAAGDEASPLSPGTAARIFTGANIPPGANAVVMQENCRALNGAVEILQKPNPGENIRRAGEDLKQGTVALTKGTRLRPQHLALLASLGIAQASVFEQVRVALISTGEELVDPGLPLSTGKIYDSNRLMLGAAIEALGAVIVDSRRVRDRHDDTVAALRECAQKADLIISCGGVSAGEEDHVKNALDALGQLHFWKINMKPGKPLAFGSIGNCIFLGLPGNPVSAFVTQFIFGGIAMRTLQGDASPLPKPIRLASAFTIEHARQRPEFVRVQITDKGLEMFPRQGSGVLSSVCWADALALIPANTSVKYGQLLDTYPLQ